MDVKSQLKRVPGLRKAVHIVRTTLHPSKAVHFVRTTLHPSDQQWARVVMDQETERLIRGLDLRNSSALEISGQKWRDYGFGRYRFVEFPAYDVCSSVLDDQFDIIIAEQVFEHLPWPYRAVRNVFQMLAPNGAFLITTPFLIMIHDFPQDCSRWTEVGIRHLLAEGGFDINRITTGSWGNRACVRSNWRPWTTYNPWLHSLKNEPAYPVVVWALARK
jgi:SAM-dependent methyltransferase